jgi:hypothetical protein
MSSSMRCISVIPSQPKVNSPCWCQPAMVVACSRSFTGRRQTVNGPSGMPSAGLSTQRRAMYRPRSTTWPASVLSIGSGTGAPG